MIDWGLIAILGLGILLGGLLFGGPGFRRKFFMGFRKFLGGVGGGQKSTPRAKTHKGGRILEVKCSDHKGLILVNLTIEGVSGGRITEQYLVAIEEQFVTADGRMFMVGRNKELKEVQ